MYKSFNTWNQRPAIIGDSISDDDELESFDPIVLFLYRSKMSIWFFIYFHKCKQTKVTDFLKFFQAMLEFNNYKSMWIIIYTDFEVQTIRNSERT